MSFWNTYITSDRFRAEIAALPRQFPCTQECTHSGVPIELRVLLDDNSETRNRAEAGLAPELRCCWFGLSLLAMTLHSRFTPQYVAWAQENYCPIPMANVGFGCVHGTLPMWIVARLKLPPEVLAAFPAFFVESILAEAEIVTTIPKTMIIQPMLSYEGFRVGHLPRFANALVVYMQQGWG